MGFITRSVMSTHGWPLSVPDGLSLSEYPVPPASLLTR